MHTEMWEHPATQANVATLRERGALVIEPAEGRLTGADTGKGRLPDPDEIFDRLPRRAWPAASARPDLAGRHVVVSAGGTREYLDPVRFLGNRSSGLQGYALARTAAARGAEVTLVAANVSLPDPAGVKVVRVETTEELRDAVCRPPASADAVVMAAAPADFRPAPRSEAKIKKAADGAAPTLELTQNPDILAELSHHRARPGAGGRRVRRRDRRQHRARSSSWPAPSSPARAATCWWSTTSPAEPSSEPTTTRPSSWPPTVARATYLAGRRPRWPTSSGTKWPSGCKIDRPTWAPL